MLLCISWLTCLIRDDAYFAKGNVYTPVRKMNLVFNL
jgi:hypothetical protein